MGDLYGYGTAASAAGSKTLNAIKTICQHHGWSDMTTTGTAELTNFINDTLQILAMLKPWPEYMHRDGSHTFTASDDAETLTETRIVRMGTVIRSDKSAPLDEITVDDWLFQTKHHAATGPPNEYALLKSVSTGDISAELLIYPKPTASTTLYFTWQSSPVFLSGGTDVTDWPDIRMWLFSAALKKRLVAIDRDTQGVILYSAEFMDLVERAFTQSRPSYKPVIARPVTVSRKWRLQDIEKTIVS